MKRASACLAALALGVSASQAPAQALAGSPAYTPVPVQDPIGDLIDGATMTRAPLAKDPPARPFGTMAPVPDEETDILNPPEVEGDPDWSMRVTLYHSGAGGVGVRDSLGCPVVPMRTAATDPRVAPRRSILFIPETVGLEMPDGSRHDGYWYASDVGGAVKGAKIDLYTGHGRGTMKPLMKINTRTVKVFRAGSFTGCPRAGARLASN